MQKIYIILLAVTLFSACQEDKKRADEHKHVSFDSIASEGDLHKASISDFILEQNENAMMQAMVTKALGTHELYVKERNLKFSLAITAVSALPLAAITGEIEPDKKEIEDVMEIEKNRPETGSSALAQHECVASQKKYDAREHKGVPPARLQQCGNCWAYSAIGPIETSYMLSSAANGESVDLSEQQLVDCGNAGDCNGGLTFKALQWLKSTATKLMEENQDPDDGRSSSCPNETPKSQIVVEDWGVVDPSGNVSKIASIASIKEAICKYGPIACSVNATSIMQYYNGGVFSEIPSDYNNPATNHAVMIVGWDDDKNAWLMRNSWSADWGEDGYCWIDYKTNNIGRRAVWVKVKSVATQGTP